jgi:hypothetical protein
MAPISVTKMQSLWAKLAEIFVLVLWFLFVFDVIITESMNKGRNYDIFVYFCFFWQDWSLNSALHTCKAGTPLLQPCL